MLLSEYLTVGFILFGAVIMWLSASKTGKIFNILSENKYKGSWKKLRFFMLFFILGYLVAVYLVISGKNELLVLLSGLIFFFGALFVYMVVFVGLQSFKEIEDLNRNINRTELINNELERFAYIASHDLKAPLTAISTLASFIKEDLESGQTDEVLNHLSSLQGRVTRLEKLINGILNYSKLGKTKIVPVDLNSLVLSEFDNYHKFINVVVSLKGKLPIVYGDEIQLSQVVANLISNAIKYNNKEVCEVCVSGIETKKYHKITFEDNGPGIAPEYHSKVFEIFQRLEFSDEIEGTGIGLSIVKKIIETNRGLIRINSDGKQGTKFIISFLKTEKQ